VSRLRTTAEFKREGFLVHNGRYEYSKVKYVNAKTPLAIICREHGEFQQTPDKHLSGAGCQTCGGSTKSNTERFIKDAHTKHGDAYLYNDVKYGKNNKDKVVITCKAHGNFKQTPANHLTGYGCSQCADVVRNAKYHNEPTILYLLEFHTTCGSLYKLGITMKRRGIYERYRHEVTPYDILYTKLYSTGILAYAEEQKLLKRFGYYKYCGPNILVEGGDSELLTKNIKGDI